MMKKKNKTKEEPAEEIKKMRRRIISLERKLTQNNPEQICAEVIIAKRRYDYLVDNIAMGVYRNTPGPKGRFLEVNPAMVKIFEAGSKEDLLKINVSDLYKDPDKRKETNDKLLKFGFIKNEELELLTLKGRSIWASITAVMTKEGPGAIYFDGIVEDITERKRYEETMRQLALHDPLTGLPNRLLLSDRFKIAVAQSKRNQKKIIVMLLDLDKFKDINDTMGHKVGDQLLCEVGIRLTRLLRESDTVARMGGDEFLLLLPGIVHIEAFVNLGNKIMSSFQRPFIIDERQINITTSIGITVYPDEGKDIDTLIKNADIAMYTAKQNGRNQYCHYNPALKEKAEIR